MNKTLIVAAVSALAATGALAQSSVTIYGRLNTTVERQNAKGVKTTQVANNNSRFGFKGTEDLGGGLKAAFNLESGFNSDTGAAAANFFGRQAEVNLSGSFGTVRLGNFLSEAYFAVADYISMHNHDTGSSSDALYAYINFPLSNQNKIAYRLPEIVKGMSLEAAVSAGEGRGPRSWDFAWNYSLGSLQLGAGYQKSGDANQFALRGLYEMGAVVLGAYVQEDENGFGANLGKRTTYRLSGAYNMGTSEFHVNFGSAGKYNRVANSKADQFTLGYNYNLSKRTKAYGYYTKVNDGAAKVYGGDFNSFALGVRHNF